MKKKTFLEKLDSFNDGWGIQQFLQKDFDGGCPCFSNSLTIEGEIFEVWGRCWRVSDNVQDLHIYAEDSKFAKQAGKRIKKALDAQKWHNPYTIIYHKTSFNDLLGEE